MVWKIFSLVATLGLLTLAGFFVFQCVYDYRAMAPEDKANWKTKIWALAYGSATKVWARFVSFVGTVLGVILMGSDLLGMPQVTDAIRAYLQPQYVAAALLVIGVLTTMARNRTLFSDKA